MTAGTYDLEIEQGATWIEHFEWRDPDDVLVPLAGKEARLQIRAPISSSATLLDISTTEGSITLTDPGVIDIRVSAVTTAALEFNRAPWSLEVFDPLDPADVTRLLRGTATLTKEVTR